MSFKFNSRSWNKYAETDPLWAILTDPSRKGNNWKLDEFFESGRSDVAARVSRISERVPNAQIGSVLDFGCGVGRLTQGLAAHYDEVVGVDIADRMIELAEGFNKYGERVRYRLNSSNDLRQFQTGSFDLVFSLIVLQHIDAKDIESYLIEFLRVCKPGGVIYIQLPDRRVFWKDKKLTDGDPSWFKLIYRFTARSIRFVLRESKLKTEYILNLIANRKMMIMTPFPKRRVEQILGSANAKIVEAYECDVFGASHTGYEYIIQKQ